MERFTARTVGETLAIASISDAWGERLAEAPRLLRTVDRQLLECHGALSASA